jgi:hypothetical protein
MKMNNPWDQLNSDDARRVDTQGKYDFFWIMIEPKMPGLMLKLSNLPSKTPRLPKLKNLVISFRSIAGGAALVLGLKEHSQLELFETLCRDVVAAGEAAEDREDALSRSIMRTMRWHHLLRGGRTQGLSVEEQRGLIGELEFLRKLILGLGPETAVESWVGPTGASKDFELIGSCIEVKARRAASKPFVFISSADQLADVDGHRLFLRVSSVSSAILPEGQDLHDHVRMTAELLEGNSEAHYAWEEALYATGYDLLNKYDDRRWLLEPAINFEIVEGFPRIIPPLLNGVEGLRYSVSLEACAPFEFHEDLIENIKVGLV